MRLVEERRAAADTCECPWPFREVLVCAGPFGCLLSCHPVGKIIQLFTPFRIGFNDFFHLSGPSLGIAVNEFRRGCGDPVPGRVDARHLGHGLNGQTMHVELHVRLGSR